MRYNQTLAISERHTALLRLVGQGSFSSPALAKKLGVSQPTIHRDILFLRSQGHRIESVRRASGWAYQLVTGDEDASSRSGHPG
jgi:DeoR/GlpR family transcriptional regulator of sugar metabolism